MFQSTFAKKEINEKALDRERAIGVFKDAICNGDRANGVCLTMQFESQIATNEMSLNQDIKIQICVIKDATAAADDDLVFRRGHLIPLPHTQKRNGCFK